MEATMKKLKCKRCGFEWEYNGKKNVMATCPDCMGKVRIQAK